MSKAIKMVAVVDGEEIVVGRCHPGQARLLRKNGLAVWAQDKIILTSPPPRTIEESVQMDTLEALEALAKEGKTHVIEDGGLKVTFSDEEMEGWKKHPPTWGGLPEGWYPHPIYEKLFERNNNWQGSSRRSTTKSTLKVSSGSRTAGELTWVESASSLRNTPQRSPASPSRPGEKSYERARPRATPCSTATILEHVSLDSWTTQTTSTSPSH